MSNQNLLTKKEAADYLGVSAGFIDTRMRKEEISYIKLGKKVRFKQEDLDGLFEYHASVSKDGFEVKATPKSNKPSQIPFTNEEIKNFKQVFSYLFNKFLKEK